MGNASKKALIDNRTCVSYWSFGVEIITLGGKASFIEPTQPHFRLDNGTEYQIQLTNASPNNANCDADVFIDDNHIGLYRIDTGCSLTLPGHKLIFQSQIDSPYVKISVHFKPEISKTKKIRSHQLLSGNMEPIRNFDAHKECTVDCYIILKV